MRRIFTYRLFFLTFVLTSGAFASGKSAPQSPRKHEAVSLSRATEVTALPIDGILFDTAPRIVKKAAVKIPKAEKKAHSKGVVVIRLVVESSGSPSNPDIMRNTTGSNVLAAVAMTAAMQSKFLPATKNKKPVKSLLSIPFIF